MTNEQRKSQIPDVPVPAGIGGNLLSNVAPPSELPNFVTVQPVVVPHHQDTSSTLMQPLVSAQLPTTQVPLSQLPPSQLPPGVGFAQNQQKVNTLTQTSETFSPAIPLSKGEPKMSIRTPEACEATQSLESTPETETIGDVMPGSGILTWVKGAVSTGGILHRVAEKAKSSVDSMITTLDPQMKEYLNSGGDVYVVVASNKDVKISPVRDAFQAVFGKATVEGHEAQSEVTAAQPVGYASAYAAAKQRIAHIRSTRSEMTNNVPIVAIESYIHEEISDKWYETSLLLLSKPSLGIELQLMSQSTPVPLAAATAVKAATSDDYAHIETGYSATVGEIMAHSLQVSNTQWQEATTGVSRRDILVLAAKSLAGSYKKLLEVSQAKM